MATDQQFCLRWNNHQSTLISVFDSLLENGTLVDCTLAAEGQYLKAHKVVLSACSPYLETLLSQHYEKHPIVILKDVKFTELKSMMDYMYRGEVNISQDQLGTFLKAAESLQIKGLSDNGDDARDVGSTVSKRQDAPSRPSVTQVRTPVESKRPAPSGDMSDASRDGSISPSSLRKRRRTRRPSQGDDPDLDTTNSCDLPSQAQSNPLPVPSSTVVQTPVQNLPKQIVKQEPSISRLDNSPIAPESGLLKEKIEPPSEPLLEPKTEYLDYMNNENSIEVEDLTLDDDEEDLNSSMDSSRPGPSHGDMSNQGYPPWPMTGDQSGTDEIFMAAQQAVGAATGQQRDSQGCLEEPQHCVCDVCGSEFAWTQNLPCRQCLYCSNILQKNLSSSNSSSPITFTKLPPLTPISVTSKQKVPIIEKNKLCMLSTMSTRLPVLMPMESRLPIVLPERDTLPYCVGVNQQQPPMLTPITNNLPTLSEISTSSKLPTSVNTNMPVLTPIHKLK